MTVCVRLAGHDGDCVPLELPEPPAVPEPSREDRYEAAVRAVLDLIDRTEAEYVESGMWAQDAAVKPEEIRAAIRSALAGGAPAPAPEPPVSISGPGAASARLSVPELVLGPEASAEAWAAHGGEPAYIAHLRLEAARRDQNRGGQR